MCVIVAIPAGTEYPSDETLKACWNTNPDGAGFMYADGKQVIIRKGFMKWEDFAEALDAEMIPKESAVVMHFRIATSGKVQPKCCHPFPISSDKEDLQDTAIESRFGIAHNGVIQGRHTEDGWSDTMDFVANVVAPLARMHPSFMYSDDAKELLQGACRSKLAIMNHASELMLVGDFTNVDGAWYSNTNHLWRTSGWSSYGNVWSRWDDYYSGFSWDDEEDEDDWYKGWDEIDFAFESCEACPMVVDCGAEKPCCEDELEALAVCADLNDCSKAEVLEMLGYAPELLSAE